MAGKHTLAEPRLNITPQLSIPSPQTNDPSKNQLCTLTYNFLFLKFLRYSPDNILKVKMTMASSNVNLFIYLWFYVAFNNVQVILRRVVGRAEETSILTHAFISRRIN